MSTMGSKLDYSAHLSYWSSAPAVIAKGSDDGEDKLTSWSSFPAATTTVMLCFTEPATAFSSAFEDGSLGDILITVLFGLPFLATSFTTN
jgi:hypothetical protein